MRKVKGKSTPPKLEGCRSPTKKGKAPNYCLVKIHRSYTVFQIADLFQVHRNSVRRWIAQGLPTVDNEKPYLVRGSELREFLIGIRKKNRRVCGVGEMYCMRCRLPKVPQGNWAELTRRTEKVGNLAGFCPDCDAMMNRCVSLTKWTSVIGNLEVDDRVALQHLIASDKPTVNSDFKKEE